MPTVVKITTVGSSVGIVLPREILAQLHAEKGDMLYLTESPDGIRITPYDADLARKGNKRTALVHFPWISAPE
jgi:putative addiction module antidote